LTICCLFLIFLISAEKHENQQRNSRGHSNLEFFATDTVLHANSAVFYCFLFLFIRPSTVAAGFWLTKFEKFKKSHNAVGKRQKN
jgi:hypothetical protein